LKNESSDQLNFCIFQHFRTHLSLKKKILALFEQYTKESVLFMDFQMKNSTKLIETKILNVLHTLCGHHSLLSFFIQHCVMNLTCSRPKWIEHSFCRPLQCSIRISSTVSRLDVNDLKGILKLPFPLSETIF